MVRLGPLLMTVSLAALAVLLPLQDGMPVPVHSVLLAVTLAGVGLGVGLGWPHLLTRVMKVAVAGEENLAASANYHRAAVCNGNRCGVGRSGRECRGFDRAGRRGLAHKWRR